MSHIIRRGTKKDVDKKQQMGMKACIASYLNKVSVTTMSKPDFPKWKVGTDVDSLAVTAELAPDSLVYADLKPGTVLQQCGELQRLPTGLKRIPVKFKRKNLDEILNYNKYY